MTSNKSNIQNCQLVFLEISLLEKIGPFLYILLLNYEHMNNSNEPVIW